MSRLLVLVMVVGCSGKTEDTPKPTPIIQNQDLGSRSRAPDAAPAEPPVSPAPPPSVELWPNAPSGSRMLGDWSGQFGVGPGFVYACSGGKVRAAPKGGGATIERGECGPYGESLLSDGTNMFWCDKRGPMMLAPQGPPTLLLDLADGCIAADVDDAHFYFIVPAFEGVPNAGLYRVAKDGGEPTMLVPTRKGVQLVVAVDSDSVWIGNVYAGTISRMKKSGGAAQVVVSGQKGIVELLSSTDDIYWFSEDNHEIRKRNKRGGAITGIVKNVSDEPIALHDGTLYWTSLEPGQDVTSTLYRLRPGANEPTAIMSGLDNPEFVVDDDGIFVGQREKTGILAISHDGR